ncbi:MAG TPA: cysteine peptidase family C39 domain-containing protein, partial [Nevskiales bacterium]|nr:cysteine peptidase family C39 domain-containing protein [Nevskiales bacterium]
MPGLGEPLVSTGPTTAEEDRALALAVQTYRQPQNPALDYPLLSAPLAAFVEAHPQSAWNTALLANLGIGFYQAGYFSRAIESWRRAWATGRHATAPEARVLADRALGELARMYARLGYAEKLQALLAEADERAVSGPATETLAGAREALWSMRNDPGMAFLCGPRALQNLLLAMDSGTEQADFLEALRSDHNGFTLAEVSEFARQAGLSHQIVHRLPGQPVPVPAIVHWRLNHFAAIVSEKDGLYQVQDPTFASGELWMTRSAIDTEASGYFLVPAARVNRAWRQAARSEVAAVYGMGLTGNNDPNATKPNDEKLHDCSVNAGMCGYNIHAMTVSLNLTDAPVGYTPPIGPDMRVTLTYNQREANQPATFGFFNVGPKWTFNWLSYVQDSPASPGSSVRRYVAGGGAVVYTGYSSSTGAFAPEVQGSARLVRIPATGPAIRYELRMPDGGRQVFAHADGASSSPRRMFLSQVVDAQGNAATLNYDNQLRLTSVRDATGRDTVFSYELSNRPLLVTRITDPFGRSARLAYDSQGRLVSITDVLGLVSSFEYDASSLIVAMTTPYGTSRFQRGGNDSNFRWLEATDPMGYTERLEYRHSAPGISDSDPAATVPVGMAVRNQYLQYRNSFHWDKHVYATHGTANYGQARLTHWLHEGSTSLTAGIAESRKNALEGRVWYTYPDQTDALRTGSLDKPAQVGRVLDDGATQRTSATYNSLGNVTSRTDAVGRRTYFDYAPNGIDLLRVRQQISASDTAIIASFTYNDQHLPLTATDAAGQTTHYAYNAAGQLTAETNPLGEVTRYEYDALGYLQRIVNANGVTALGLTYDGYGRIASRTDAEGHTLQYQYDDLDRLTAILYPDGTRESFSWDRLDLVAVTD